MALFTPDLYRHFAIGLAGGALIMAASTASEWADHISPPANAAERVDAPQASGDFWTLSE